MKKLLKLLTFSLMIFALLTACSQGNDNNKAENDEKQNSDGPSGEILVLTNRTDIVDTVFKEYAEKFNEKYPDVKVEFEAITDYEGQVKVRMNSTEYGDALLIPNDVPLQDLENYFEPLGTIDELSQKYLHVDEDAYENNVYGIPIVVNAQGLVYNKKVFEEAGITDIPTSPEAFLEAMKKVKDSTKAIPYYTNYAAGWPLTQWEPNRLSISGEEDYVNVQMANMDDPFAKGKPHYILYKMMYDLAKEGLIENDPLTTDWESSKEMLAKGEIATMVLGSWAITQVQDLAENRDDIGYMPFPYNHDGKQFSESSGDYKIGINKNSENKEAAKAWVEWFINESNYAQDNGGISPVIGDELPDTLASFEELGVELIKNAPAKEGQEGLVDAIDNEGEIGLFQPEFKQRIIEAAIGNKKESFDEIMNDLNKDWKEARAKVAK
ncbi:ABC-type glycerol-3-phosphate transport system substrate-binding protein [Metabacillus malikii]|uniref:ABC-type glycerol-3-phosphate transport system substrate-binding protein n=1 Tax=Metabacillus malikii TaxID=1504265 RepID=A0ABT9ZNC8_9BACI|nr:extracellular solute-binding protein [Metabacillus malikii]MDQ0233505.1 ABC-type glycerol-3-phosphate transport system substrate-binding protein [Metabacillus malikii]